MEASLAEMISEQVWLADTSADTFFERLRKDAASGEWLARQRRKIDGGLREVARLAGDRIWTVGNTFGLGDIATGTMLGYMSLRFAEMPWRTQYPNLAALSDRLEQRASFKDSVPYAQTISDKIV